MLGCIADDITGATDLASALTNEGWRTIMMLGVPDPAISYSPDCDAIVVALKSRNLPAHKAVDESVTALDWLRSGGITRFYLKYCSTFDSTADGNIGPVTEAMMRLVGADQVVHAPAYPDNGRTVYQGHLFVGTALLSESGMERHPLTPMTDPNLVRVLTAQTSSPVGLLAHQVVTAGASRMRDVLAGISPGGPSHVIADAISSADLDEVAGAVAERTLLAGGAAFGASWPEPSELPVSRHLSRWRRSRMGQRPFWPGARLKPPAGRSQPSSPTTRSGVSRRKASRTPPRWRVSWPCGRPNTDATGRYSSPPTRRTKDSLPPVAGSAMTLHPNG